MHRDPSLDPQLTVDQPRALAESTLDATGAYQSAPTTEPATDASGAPLGLPSIPGFEIARELARGGMGRVLAGRELALDREVAIKVLLPGANAERFLAESKITAKLPHPSIPPVYALGQLADSSPYLAMKLVRGRTLAEELKARPDVLHDLPRFVQVFEQICQAVGFAHAQGIIHRDLKPANVIVGAFGEVQVMDWGLARELRSAEFGARNEGVAASSPELTQAGAIMGTPAYMAPEQARGEPVDARADVFALGGILGNILTGRSPFAGTSAVETVRKAAAADLTDIRTRLDASGADADLIALTKQCLSPEVANRPLTGQAVADAVASYRSGVEDRLRKAETDRAASEAKAVEQRKRRRVVRIAAGALATVLLAGIGVSTWQAFRATDAEKATFAQLQLTTDAEAQARIDRDSAVVSEGNARASEVKALAQRAKAEKARDRTRDVLDAMTSEVTGDSLATQKAITEEQKKFLAEVLTYYKEFAGEQSDDERSRKRTANTAHKVGLIEYRLGHLEEAATAFRMALDVNASLAADFATIPAVPEYRQHLAASHLNLGLLLAYLGKQAEAEAEYRKALAIYEKLAADFPAVPAYRQELAASYLNLGLLLVGLGKRAEAEAEYRQALAIQERLAADFPTVPEYRQHLATGHNNLGILLADLGKRAEAEAEYRKALAIQKKLAIDFPAMPAYRLDLGGSHSSLGFLLAGLGKRAEADVEDRRALAIYEKLAADFPAVPEYRQHLATGHNHLGILLADLGKRAEAEAEYRKALAIQVKLVADSPAIPAHRLHLARSHNNLGILLKNLEKRAEAEEEYKKALAIRERLAADFPAVPLYHVELGASYGSYGSLILDQGRPAASLEWFDLTIRILQSVHGKEPRDVTAKQFLRNGHRNRAVAYDQLQKPAEAVKDWNLAIELSPPAVRPGLRASRASSQLMAGMVTEAVAEVAELSKNANWNAAQWYDFACVYAVASNKIADEKQEYADWAMEMLRKAVKAGYKDAAHMAKDMDLDPLRDRADFKKLLAELEKKKPAENP